jgi:SesB domain on fungal death-pathway protein
MADHLHDKNDFLAKINSAMETTDARIDELRKKLEITSEVRAQPGSENKKNALKLGWEELDALRALWELLDNALRTSKEMSAIDPILESDHPATKTSGDNTADTVPARSKSKQPVYTVHFSGSNNQGLQIGQNYGSIHMGK